MNKKMYIIPETKVSEFKTQMMCVSVYIEDGEKAEHDESNGDGGDALSPSRNTEADEWGNLWNN